MRKFIAIILSIITMANITAFAAEIPIEIYPEINCVKAVDSVMLM